MPPPSEPPVPSREVLHRLRWGSAATAVGFLLLAALVGIGWHPLVHADLTWSARCVRFTVTHPGWQTFWRTVTDAGGTPVVAVATTAGVVWCAVRRRWRLGLWFALTVVSSSLLNAAAKSVMGRIRPPSADALTAAHGFSFPSGHTQAGTVTYVGLVLVVWWQLAEPRRRLRRYAEAAVVLLVGAIGVSRVLLGAHWPSDVVGGWLLGSSWVTAAAVLVVLGQRRRRSA